MIIEITVSTVVIAANTAPVPVIPLTIEVYVPTVRVIVLLLYKMIEAEISVMMATQLKMAPEIMPFFIIGTVIRTKVLSLDAPRLMEASSTDKGICIKVAVADRTVYNGAAKAYTTGYWHHQLILPPLQLSCPTTDGSRKRESRKDHKRALCHFN